MEKTYDKSLQARLEEYIAGIGGQRKAAAAIGYSEATISNYRNSKYIGDVAKLESRLRELLGNADAAAELATPDTYVPTSISRGVYETIRLCHLKGGLAIECGDAGIGKTRAAQKYAEDYPNSSIYITVNPCLVTIAAFLKLLCRRLKIPTGRKDDMWMEAESHLHGGRKVLIIDEAQHLPIKTIEAIRAFYDSNPELGIIMIGNAETVTHGGAATRESFAQIRNRTKLTEIRRTTQITREDISMLFPALVGEKEIDLLHVIAQSEQAVRGAANLYSNAMDNDDISYAGLTAMARVMKIITY